MSTTMVPAVLRHDTCLRARPDLRHGIDGWWGGAQMDPQVYHAMGSGDGGLSPREASSPSYGGGGRERGGFGGDVAPLLRAVAVGDVEGVRALLLGGAHALVALHAALHTDAAPKSVALLAAWSDELNESFPRPVVVTWARHLCEPRSCRGVGSRADARHRSIERLDVLLAAKADINSMGQGCESALHVVARHLQALATAEAAGGPPDGELPRQSCGHLACDAQQVWHALLSRGADPYLPNGQGLTPLELLSVELERAVHSAKRPLYATKRYESARLRGEDLASMWAGADDVCTPTSRSTPRASSAGLGTPRSAASASTPPRSAATTGVAVPSGFGGCLVAGAAAASPSPFAPSPRAGPKVASTDRRRRPPSASKGPPLLPLPCCQQSLASQSTASCSGRASWSSDAGLTSTPLSARARASVRATAASASAAATPRGSSPGILTPRRALAWN
mmetsp:Transcript_99191/g.318239  ORF Transcript_99191/g.318239 Transcript_99191/m.318239 type:complete len:452 (-) Transcript_99191:136-1491(-)